jgi:hypothetical protein
MRHRGSCVYVRRLPLPNHLLGLRICVQSLDYELHSHADAQLSRADALRDLPEHDHSLGFELDGRNGKTLKWIG